MALIALGSVAVGTPGTLVAVYDPAKPAMRCQTVFFAALNHAAHQNTGNVYVYGPGSDGAITRIFTLPKPSATTTPTFSVSIPGSQALNPSAFKLDADNANDGCDISIITP